MKRSQNKEYNCPCLDIAGQLNYTRKGVPIEDCQTCHGTGFIQNKPDLILCSDLHIREDTPTCFKGDFQKEQWDSLGFIKELQKKHNCPVLCGGDVFHHWKPSPFLLSETIKHLPEQFFTCYGNHDLPQHNLDLLEKCGVYTLKQANCLKTIGDGFDMFHWGETPELDLSSDDEPENILVWHVLTYKNNLPYPGCVSLSAKRILKKYPQYNLIVTGDNHQPFVEEYEERLLVNPGSMTRQTADQFDHKPRVYLWYSETNTVEAVYLPIEPAEKVISREHIDITNQRNERLESFVAQLNFLGIGKPRGSEGGTTFEENLKQFENKNQVRSSVMQIVHKAIEV